MDGPVTGQNVPCDDCGVMLTVILSPPRDLGDGCTLASLAVAWADTHFQCQVCSSKAKHPALHSHLRRLSLASVDSAMRDRARMILNSGSR